MGEIVGLDHNAIGLLRHRATGDTPQLTTELGCGERTPRELASIEGLLPKMVWSERSYRPADAKRHQRRLRTSRDAEDPGEGKLNSRAVLIRDEFQE